MQQHNDRVIANSDYPGGPPEPEGIPHECPACHAENDLPTDCDGVGECYNCGFDGEMVLV